MITGVQGLELTFAMSQMSTLLSSISLLLCFVMTFCSITFTGNKFPRYFLIKAKMILRNELIFGNYLLSKVQVSLHSYWFIFFRALHHRKLYKHIHKIHHEWQSPMAAVSTYAHPFEHFLTGIVSPSMGPLLMGTPLCVHWAWYLWLVVQTMNDHSGYHLPLAFSPEFHDYHHLKWANKLQVFLISKIISYFSFSGFIPVMDGLRSGIGFMAPT